MKKIGHSIIHNCIFRREYTVFGTRKGYLVEWYDSTTSEKSGTFYLTSERDVRTLLQANVRHVDGQSFFGYANYRGMTL